MIKEIVLKNFQSHKKTKLKLHPGVNVIIGKTDSGKTAIMRALKWVITNRPKGEAFRSDWGGTTSVSILTDDHLVKRIKTDKVNQYKLRDNDEEKLEFNAIGLGVPDEISDVLNMNEINLQSQFDQPFLLNDTPGSVALHFNKIAHLERIDTSTGAIKKWISKINQSITADKDSLIEAKEGLESYDYLEKFEIDIEVLESLEKIKLQTINSKAKLSVIIKETKEIQTEIKDNALILSAERPVNKILAFYTEKESVYTQKVKLSNLLRDITECKEELKEEEDTMEMGEDVSALLLLYKKKKELNEKYMDLNILLNRIKLTKSMIIASNSTIKEKEKEFKKEMPSTCPLCNQKIK